MITEALRHCRGIGPARLAQLHDRGVRTWQAVLAYPERVPPVLREALVAESRRSMEALERDDVWFFVDRFYPQDRWRIVAHFLDRISFFDIETTGLDYDSAITVIACWHRGWLHTFVEHENLDEFLDLLEEVDLLVSFNGSTFDVPRVTDAFHIPQLPCPHLDLRWPCFHQGLRGSLKDIARRVGIVRPADVASVDGNLATQLWAAWRDYGDAAAKRQLLRYCAADVLLLVLLSHHLSDRRGEATEDLWSHLPAAPAVATTPVVSAFRRTESQSGGFGHASPTKLRARRRQGY